MFHALMLAPRRDRIVQRIVKPGGAEFDPVVLAEPGDRRVIQDDFRYRGEIDGFQLFDGALADRIEPPRPVQHIAKQIEPHRAGIAGGIDVDDAATHRVVAGFRHGGSR